MKRRTIIILCALFLTATVCFFIMTVVMKPNEGKISEKDTTSAESTEQVYQSDGDSGRISEETEKQIISFSRSKAGHIETPEKPSVDPSGGYRGHLINNNERLELLGDHILSVGESITTDDLTFMVNDAVFSEKEGNFSDGDSAPYYNVYLVLNCDITNDNPTNAMLLANKYQFNLIEGTSHLFPASSVGEKEYFSFYDSLQADTMLKGVTVSFIGSRSLLTNSDELYVQLICDDELVACWKISPSFIRRDYCSI